MQITSPDGGWNQRWVLSYIIDYLILIFLICGFSALDLAEPYHQPFSLDNDSLKYPYADPERISPFWAAVISCLFPIVCIVVWTMVFDGMYSHHKPAANRARIMGGPWQLKDRLWEMNCGILGLGLSVAGAICITGALKNATGKPRPDIIARCLPHIYGATSPVEKAPVNPYLGLVTSAICKQPNNKILKDGFKSWPSGHASTAFAGLGYLSLFLAGKLHLMDNRGEVWKTVIVLVPILSAALVAVSRIMDARHHPFDVLTGAALGSVTAWISYRQYFPSVANPKAKGRAYKPRTWGTDAIDMQSGTLATEDTDYTRAMEEGRNASSESLDSVGGTRKRSQNPMAMMHSRTFTSSPLQGESGSQEFELLPQQRVATFPMDPPTHAQPVREHDGASRSADDSEWRRSVDMGESHGRNMMDSPEGRPLGLNRLSLPPGEVPVPVRV